MQTLRPTRSLTTALLLASALTAHAAQTPYVQSPSAQTQPTKPSPAIPAPSLLPPTPTTVAPPPTPSQLPPVHAEITYSGGILSVTASNSSLNQILREISRETGITITGGVADERVFGHYGPNAPAQILADLLDGTGSNMLIVHRDGAAPSELILTPRLGGPSPPNPNAAVFDDRNEPANQPPPPAEEPPSPHAREGFIPANEPNATPALGAAPPAADSNDPQSPNGVKTPQQIYDQLQRMRAQQQPQPPQ
jgi:hypothetical protein